VEEVRDLQTVESAGREWEKRRVGGRSWAKVSCNKHDEPGKADEGEKCFGNEGRLKVEPVNDRWWQMCRTKWALPVRAGCDLERVVNERITNHGKRRQSSNG
jgi:hypothetical protein